MNDPWSGNESLPYSIAQRVDAACYRFEKACKEGRHPRIEDFLDEAGRLVGHADQSTLTAPAPA